MPEPSVNPTNTVQPVAAPVPGSPAHQPLSASVPLAMRQREPDWPGHFWATLTPGLPAHQLLKNPYFPAPEQALGGWRGIIEQALKPHGRVEGITNRRQEWLVTPEEALNKHAVDTAQRLLKEPPEYFPGPAEHTYFAFLEVAYSQYPEWAIIHRAAGELYVREDYRLSRPAGETTMMATVVGPIFQLGRSEVRLWETVAHFHARAFEVIEDEADPSS